MIIEICLCPWTTEAAASKQYNSQIESIVLRRSSPQGTHPQHHAHLAAQPQALTPSQKHPSVPSDSLLVHARAHMEATISHRFIGPGLKTPARIINMQAMVAFRGQFCRRKRGGRADASYNPEVASANPGSSEWFPTESPRRWCWLRSAPGWRQGGGQGER